MLINKEMFASVEEFLSQNGKLKNLNLSKEKSKDI